MATKTTQAIRSCERTAVESAIQNRAPLADFDEYLDASDAADAVVGDDR